jgi:phosphomannomutase
VDGDRIGFVTGEGTALSEEYSLPLVVTPRLRRRPGPVVTSYSSSGMVEALARSYGQRVIRGPVGESHIVDLGLAEEAVLAGEGSGGVAVLPLGVAYDGLLALGLVLEEMATSRRSLAELADDLPRLFMRKQELPCPPTLVYRVIERFRRHHAGDAPDCTDGVRLSWDDAWLHVRASGTEPLLRIIAEAPTQDRAETLVEEAAVFARRITFGHEGS